MQIKPLFNTMFILAWLMTVSCEDCGCVGTAIELEVVDGIGQSLVADDIRYQKLGGNTHNLTQQDIEDQPILIGDDPGDYRIWITVDDIEWDSKVIEVEEGGPDDCPYPKTQILEVQFDKAMGDVFVSLEDGETCGD